MAMSEGESEPGWRARAQELRERGDLPERRAEVIALVEAGYSHSEVAETLGLGNRSNVAVHVRLYREQDLAAAEWLVAHGPDI